MLRAAAARGAASTAPSLTPSAVARGAGVARSAGRAPQTVCMSSDLMIDRCVMLSLSAIDLDESQQRRNTVIYNIYLYSNALIIDY